MTAPVFELMKAVRAAGGVLTANGDRLKVRAPAPLPDPLMQRLRDAKPAILQALAIAEDYRALFEERAALCQHEGAYTRAEAEMAAWAEIEANWHLKHGEPAPFGECAGCGQYLGTLEGLVHPDGARTHLGCLDRYSARWRTAASAALAALGLTPPVKVKHG